MTGSLDERLRRLGAWADPVGEPGFTFGQWVAPRTGADGVIQHQSILEARA